MRYPNAGRHQLRADFGGALVCGVLTLFSSGCGRGPTAPPPVAPVVVSLELACPTSLLVGQSSFCFALAHYSDGSMRNNVSSTWSSSDPNVASFATLGRIFGRGAGLAVISSQYEGGLATAQVSVRAEDFLTVTGAAVQGLFQAGRNVTMTAVGEYGVASVANAELSIEITGQDGSLITASTSQTVAKGGDSFVLSATFVIPPTATVVCRTAVLRIGTQRFTAVGDPSLFPCISVGRP